MNNKIYTQQMNALNGYNNYKGLGSHTSTPALWGTIIAGAVVASVAVPIVIDTLAKTQLLGFENKYNWKTQAKRSAALGAAIAVPFAVVYGGLTYSALDTAMHAGYP